MIATYGEQIMRWQGHKQGDGLGSNYGNLGMRRQCLSAYCEFNAVYIVNEDQCKGAIWFIFSLSTYPPGGPNLIQKGKDKSVTCCTFSHY